MAQNLIQYGDFVLSNDYPNLLTNGDFTSFTGDDPDDWTVNETGSGTITKVAGEDQVRFQAPGGGDGAEIVQTVLRQGTLTFAARTNVVAAASGDLWVNNVQIPSVGVTNLAIAAIETDPSPITYQPIATPSDASVDTVKVRIMPPWVFEKDWDLWTDGVATWTSTADDNIASLEQDIISSAGQRYKITLTLSGVEPGVQQAADFKIIMNIDLGTGSTNAYVNSDGTHEIYVTAGDGTRGFFLRPLADTEGDTFDLSDVSVELINPGSSSDTIIVSGGLFICDGGKLGPVGKYVRTQEIVNGFNTWKVTVENPHCADAETVFWYAWFGTNEWVIGENTGTKGDNDWTAASVANNPSNLTFSPNGTSTGDAITFNAPSPGINSYRHRYPTKYRARYDKNFKSRYTK
ncbi:MAG: hypothetical protein KAS32_22110 [Candidatus Peribacteraceae bacterium]|nr:hypothetical protein [Candidatus Peribacteraceae bacterium]